MMIINSKRFLAGIAALLALSGPVAAATVELVTNGGFEDGNSGFTTDFTNGSPATFPGLATVSVTSGPFLGLTAFEGDNFLAVNGGSDVMVDPVVWSQDVSVVAGTTYSFSVALGTAFPSVFGNLSVQLGGLELIEITAPMTDNTYEVFTTDFVAAATGDFALSFVELSTSFGGNDYGLDNISLTFDDATTPPPAVPLPAGGLLLVSGLGLLALRRRST